MSPAGSSVSRPSHLHDREEEWDRLTELLDSPRFELAVVLGRRRVGKTALLKPLTERASGVYYQATRRTEAEQLRSLSHIVAERFEDPGLRHGGGFEGWEALFSYLTARVGDEPFLVVLDEYPYLESSARGLSSELQKIVDHQLEGTRIKLVLSGSHISAMKQLESSAHPLYQRRTARLVLAPFDYRDAARFYPGYSSAGRLRAFGIFGGVPGHLSLVDDERTLARNVCRQILDPAGRLYDEAEHMLDAFLSEAGLYYSILEAIATGERTWSGITSRTGKPGGSISRPLDWLREMEFVRRDVPVTSTRPKKSRRSVYRIADPYVRFWYRLVSPLIEAGVLGHASPDRVWETEIEPRLPDYMGETFEEVCRDWARRDPAELPFSPLRVGRWWDASSENEIDVVALSGEGDLWVAECKWGGATGADLARLRERAALLSEELGGVRSTSFALISGRAGAEPDIADGDVAHLTASDLF